MLNAKAIAAVSTEKNSRSAQQPAGWIVSSLVGTLVFVDSVLSITDRVIHNPEDVTEPAGLLVRSFDQFVRDPVAAAFRHIGHTYDSAAHLHFLKLIQGPGLSSVLATLAVGAAGLVVLYGSVIGLLKIYDAFSAIKTVRGIAVIVLTLLSLPVGALATIHVFESLFHVQLLPLAQEFVDDYRQIAHWIVDKLYWLPLHFFSWKMPLWLKDLATISIVSVGMNRKAWIPKDAGHFELKWENIRDWIDSLRHIDGVFDAIEFIPQLFSLVVAWIVGRVIYLTGWKWGAERIAATTYVVLRGVLMMGLIYPAEFLWKYPRSLGDDSSRAVDFRLAARRYALYFVITSALVAWFFWTWHVGVPLVRSTPAGH